MRNFGDKFFYLKVLMVSGLESGKLIWLIIGGN